MLDPVTEASVDRLRDEIVAAFGQDLIAVALFGSAAGSDFVRGRSDLNLAIVLRTIAVPQLEVLQRELPAWHKLGMATPILLDPDFLARAVDVFPIELQDIQLRHRMLHGPDVFADISIDPAQLRFQLEQEVRAKLLRLRLAYVESDGSDEQLESLMLRSLKSFLSLAWALARRRNPAPPVGDREMLDAFCRDFSIELPVLQRLLNVRLQQDSWWNLRRAIFAAYLAEVEALVRLVDGLDGPA